MAVRRLATTVHDGAILQRRFPVQGLITLRSVHKKSVPPTCFTTLSGARSCPQTCSYNHSLVAPSCLPREISPIMDSFKTHSEPSSQLDAYLMRGYGADVG